MSRFDTLGFSDLGTGDGVSRDFPIAGQDEAVTDFAVESVRRDGWQGQVLMHPIPRTNYASYSNDFTRPEWNGSPSLFLGFKDQRYFVVDSSGALQQKPFFDIITFTRASGGGRFNAQGQYEWLPANQPRIDYDPVTGECQGLLIEESRTNLLTYSSDFANASWLKQQATVAASATTSPSGAMDATKLTENATAGEHYAQKANLSVRGGTSYSLSFYVKAAGRTRVGVLLSSTTPLSLIALTRFNLATGSVVATNVGTASITPAADGWFRVVVTGVADSSNSTVIARIQLRDDGDASSYTGDGTSGIYIWGAQLEQGAFPTSHIPTSGAQVTRAADIASVNELSPWFNPEHGTLFVEAVRTHSLPSGTAYLAELGDGTYDERIYAALTASNSNSFVGDWRSGNASPDYFVNTSPKWSPGAPARMALTWGPSGRAAAASGVIVKTSSSTVVPLITKLGIGAPIVGAGGFLNGHIRSLRFYPRRLSDDQLQALTA